MSWKIYNGFIFKNITSLEKALIFLKKQVNDFEEVADDHWRKLLVSLAIAEYDNDCVDGVRPNKKYLVNALRELQEVERDSIQKGTKSFTNCNIGVSVTTVRINEKKRIIGIVIADNKDMLEKFFSLDEIAEYAYFDNTDEPEEISEKEWNSRKDIWDKVFTPFYTISKSMWGYDLIPEKESMRFPEIKQEHIEKYAPTFQNRLKGAINHYVIKERKFSSMEEYRNFMRTKETEDAIEQALPIIENRLKKEITREDL